MTTSGYVPFTRAVGTAKLAREFFRAATMQDHSSLVPSLVAHYLYGHALELAFKAVLIAHGTTERALRKIGHDLAEAQDAALAVASADAISMDDGDVARIDMLTGYYGAKALEYVEPGYASLPILTELQQCVDKVSHSVSAYVDRTVRDQIATGRAV